MAKLDERTLAWFTPSMIAPDEILYQRLQEIIAEYDSSGVTTGRFDELMLESDKIQAELWRRNVHSKYDARAKMECLEQEIEEIYLKYLKTVEDSEFDDLNEDDAFDLQAELAAALVKEFPKLDFEDKIGEELNLAFESYIGEISDKIVRGQSPEQTKKLVALTIKRGRRFLKRCKGSKNGTT